MSTKQAIQTAMAKTLAAYARLIADPAGELAAWDNYGGPCRLCAAVNEIGGCKECPLGDDGGCLSGDMRDSFLQLWNALEDANLSEIKLAARVRRAVLARKFKAWSKRIGV